MPTTNLTISASTLRSDDRNRFTRIGMPRLNNFFPYLIISLMCLTACKPDADETPQEFVSLSPFNLLKVENLATEVVLTPTLTWEPSLGSRNVAPAKVVYEVNIAEFGTPFISGTVITTEEPFVTLTNPLEPNTEYQWLVTARVVGTDTRKAAEMTFSFETTGTSLDPLTEEITLFSPDDNAKSFPVQNGEFSWASYDSLSGISYEYLLAIKEISDAIQWQTYLTDASNVIIPDSLKSSTTYEWTVLAMDERGNSTQSETRTLTTASTGSIGFSIPANSQIISTSVRNGSGLEFGGCFGHVMVNHNDQLFDIGGRANENGTWRFGNDVYQSADGVSWTQTTPNEDNNTRWEPSDYHAALSHGGLIYVFSNSPNQIYTSSLGTVWSVIETEGDIDEGTLYPLRREPAVVSLNGNLYVMGGYNGSTNYSDVWVSGDDGITWQKIKDSDNSVWKAGVVYAVAVEGAIYLFETRENDQQDPIRIWKSTNGSTWQFLRNVPFTANDEYAVCNYLYGMCVISGDENNEIWWSEDGLEWSPVELDTPSNLQWRKGHSAVERLGSIYISYGYGTVTGDSRTDIVKIDFDP